MKNNTKITPSIDYKRGKLTSGASEIRSLLTTFFYAQLVLLRKQKKNNIILITFCEF